MPVGAPIEVHPSFRFVVKIDDIGQAAFLECKLPNLQVETFEIKEGGLNAYSHKLPVRVNAGSLTLRHGITKDAKILSWYVEVMQGKIKDAKKSVSVKMFGLDQKPLVTWSFMEAYPIKWSGPQFKTDQSALAIEELEIVYHGFSVE